LNHAEFLSRRAVGEVRLHPAISPSHAEVVSNPRLIQPLLPETPVDLAEEIFDRFRREQVFVLMSNAPHVAAEPLDLRGRRIVWRAEDRNDTVRHRTMALTVA